METTAVPFELKPESLPDKHGDPIRVGDLVRDPDGALFWVGGLEPKQRFAGGARKATGELDLGYSGIRALRYHRHESPVFVEGLTFTGQVETGRALPYIEKVELTEVQQAEAELMLAEIERDNIQAALSSIERTARVSADRVARAQRAVARAHIEATKAD